MSERLQKLLTFITEWLKTFHDADDQTIQTFTTRNTVGDTMKTIYEQDGVTLDVCEDWDYIEVFGLDPLEIGLLYNQDCIY